MTTALITLTHRIGDFVVDGFWAPLARFAKIPISLDILLIRIRKLAASYNFKVSLCTYRANSAGMAAAKKDLKSTGGIYIWYCHVTGFFYVGSGLLFFGRAGRLSTYLMPSKLANGTSVSKLLAADILFYGYDAFTLIVVEKFEVGSATRKQLRTQEQLWMLLYPTYNLTLVVGSVFGKPMSEVNRRAIASTVYQYEVDANGIISDSEQIHHGIKELVRTGFSSCLNSTVVHSISYFDLRHLLISGSVYMGRYVFTNARLEGDELTRWEPPFAYATGYADRHQVSAIKGRAQSVWVYEYGGPGHRYTLDDFVEFVPRANEVLERYGLSKSYLQRLRKYGSPSNGFLFSNVPLHLPTQT